MGAVWLATDERLRRPVAIKQLLVAGGASGNERRAARVRMRCEARLAARVEHPGTVRIYELAEEDGEPWIVMEALVGRTRPAPTWGRRLTIRSQCITGSFRRWPA